MVARARAGEPAASAPDGEFDRVVRPILSQRCGECHSEAEPESGFSIASRAAIIAGGEKHHPAVIAGDPARSPLIRVLRGTLKPRMPLRGKLNEDEIARIEGWIRNLPPGPAGAPAATAAEPWRWPFEKPARPRPPAVRDRGWVINPIDAFVRKRLEEARLEPAPPAPRLALARRVFLDLIGLPPSPEELAGFLADRSSDAYPS
jgi:mono/diheme cytochrome c family protein